MAKDYCFACLRERPGSTERAHILARCEGGIDSPVNLHMLCTACHHQSEFLSGDRYFDWFKKQTAFHSGLYFIFKYNGEVTQLIFDRFLEKEFKKFIELVINLEVDFDSNGISDLFFMIDKFYKPEFKKTIESERPAG